jgi:hypothetical protein
MKHHDEAIERYVARVSADPEVLAVVVTGSLARGIERATSDVDLYLFVTEEAWSRAFESRGLMFVDREGIGYEDGYYDVKLATLSLLDDAAERGDDPVKDSFAHSWIAFSRVDDLAARMARAASVPDEQWDARVLSFAAQADLHGSYFLAQAEESGDHVLLANAAVHLALAASRALLAHNHVLFQGPKYLAKSVAELENRPSDFPALVEAVVTGPTAANGRALLTSLEDFLALPYSDDEILSTFILDNELAWRYRTKTPEYS